MGGEMWEVWEIVCRVHFVDRTMNSMAYLYRNVLTGDTAVSRLTPEDRARMSERAWMAGLHVATLVERLRGRAVLDGREVYLSNDRETAAYHPPVVKEQVVWPTVTSNDSW